MGLLWRASLWWNFTDTRSWWPRSCTAIRSRPRLTRSRGSQWWTLWRCQTSRCSWRSTGILYTFKDYRHWSRWSSRGVETCSTISNWQRKSDLTLGSQRRNHGSRCARRWCFSRLTAVVPCNEKRIVWHGCHSTCRKWKKENGKWKTMTAYN